jgi:drug/metabolite transporter (DMT)-like permease
LKYAGVGAVIAGHWISFFMAIKVSNISITLACLASSSLFVALFEPMVSSKKINLLEILLGIVVIAGLVMIFSFEFKYKLGIFLGLLSAFLAAVFATFNSQLVQKEDAVKIGLYELICGFIWITLFFLFSGKLNADLIQISFRDTWLLLILAIVATAFAFVGSVLVMKELSPFTVSLTINLEPIYGIILALLFYGESEKMTGGFYFGALIILATLFINAWVKRKERKRNQGDMNVASSKNH